MPISGRPTLEELEAIRDSVIFPIMLTVVENKRYEWGDKSDRIMDMITLDMKRVKAKLRAANIKVWEDGYGDDRLNFGYVCRGYEDTFSIMRFVVKSELSVRIGKYFAKL